MPDVRRLPSGETTANFDEYADAWRSVYKKAEAFFNGYECCGFDPHIHIRHRLMPHMTIVLSVHAVNSLMVPI